MSNQTLSTEKFLNLQSNDQNEIFQTLSPALGKSAQILEKDVWICWTLEKLFAMPNAMQMAFKGGTSLSKVFNIIERFSEDVDVTIDYKNFNTDDPFEPGVSITKQKRISNQLKELMKDHVINVIKPYFNDCIQKETNQPIKIEVNPDGEKCEIHYSSVCDRRNPYIKPFVLVEFGARNVTEPSEIHKVVPDIASHVPQLDFPVANVNVLNPQRTFWEKLTLIHVECNRERFKENADRLSRHWYDLVKIYQSPFGPSALQDKELLKAVVNHKKVFFNESKANYDQCLAGAFNLVPVSAQLEQLRLDYQAMIQSNMFYGTPIPFEEIIQTMGSLSEVA